ncbi:LysR family transcriptional regulator [Streptomyces sp. NPDC048483]|uniref:LysR family transcriptional regulator n=1 Tax=Streptomyces sp. NPDC048483 TaxID=3154927 RepID=UPI00341B6B92
MDRDELECFLLVAEELHFGRTAERMLLSRARVSQLVQRLERRVGAPLFVRTSRRVALTALGRQLRADLEPHHRAIDAALAKAAAAARGVSGVLHVGFSSPLAGEIVMRAAEALRAGRPELVVEVCEVPLADPYGPLRKGEFDVQLTELPVREEDLGEGPALLTEERVLAIASGHPLAIRRRVSLEDLAEVPLLTIAGELPAYRREHQVPAHTPGGRPIARGPAVTNMQEALMLVAAGKGAFPAAAHTATYYARPGVSYLPFDDAAPVGYGLVWRAGESTGAVRAFAQTVLKVARSSAEKAVESDGQTAGLVALRAAGGSAGPPPTGVSPASSRASGAPRQLARSLRTADLQDRHHAHRLLSARFRREWSAVLDLDLDLDLDVDGTLQPKTIGLALLQALTEQGVCEADAVQQAVRAANGAPDHDHATVLRGTTSGPEIAAPRPRGSRPPRRTVRTTRAICFVFWPPPSFRAASIAARSPPLARAIPDTSPPPAPTPRWCAQSSRFVASCFSARGPGSLTDAPRAFRISPPSEATCAAGCAPTSTHPRPARWSAPIWSSTVDLRHDGSYAGPQQGLALRLPRC